MFRITQDPSSGSDNVYLIEMKYNGLVVLIMCVVGVWRHVLDLWCVYALCWPESYCIYVKLRDRKRSLSRRNVQNAVWHQRNSHNAKFRVVAVFKQPRRLLGQVMLGQVRLSQVRLGQVRLGWVGLGWVRLGQVRLGQVRSHSRSEVASDFQSETLTLFTVTSTRQNFALWLFLNNHDAGWIRLCQVRLG